MRCPKCGAFLDPGKDVCFMCGVNINTYVPDNNSFAAQNPNQNFGSGQQFSNPNMNQNNSGFGPSSGGSILDPSKAYNKTKANDKDIFDFYAEHKSVVRLLLLVLFAGILVFAGFKYLEFKSKPKELVPIVQDLYYEIDDSFENVAGSSRSGGNFYTLTGDKGNDCSINVMTGSTASENYVEEYFESVKAELNPTLDKEGNVEDPLKVYTSQESSVTINNTKWYYLNIFYRKDLNSDFNILKYKYMVALNKGYYYTVILNNNTNSNTCNSGLDNFVKSLEFVDNNK